MENGYNDNAYYRVDQYRIDVRIGKATNNLHKYCKNYPVQIPCKKEPWQFEPGQWYSIKISQLKDFV